MEVRRKVKTKISSAVANQEKENSSSDSVIFVGESKNESGSSFFGDNELSASETSSFSCDLLPPDYTEQLKKLYAGIGSMFLKRGKQDIQRKLRAV